MIKEKPIYFATRAESTREEERILYYYYYITIINAEIQSLSSRETLTRYLLNDAK